MIKNGVTVFRNESEVEAAKAAGFVIVEAPEEPAKEPKKPEPKKQDAKAK